MNNEVDDFFSNGIRNGRGLVGLILDAKFLGIGSQIEINQAAQRSAHQNRIKWEDVEKSPRLVEKK